MNEARTRRSAIVSFVTGILSAVCGLSWWFAGFSVPVALVGIAAGVITRRRENASHEPHNRLNLIGLILNMLGPAVFLFQVTLAIVIDLR